MGLSFCILLFLLHFNEGIHGLQFTKNPSNQTVTQGNMARLGCAFEGLSEPEIIWIKDGEKIYSTDQMYITLDAHHWETFHSVKSVQQQDAGKYWCEVEYHGRIIPSEPAWITVEGVPHFVVEPKDVAAFAGEPFNLTCAASGPPEPVEVLWWLGGEQKGDFTPSPSVLFIKGVNDSIKFYCEAKNARGISVSRTGTVHIKVRPDSPQDVKVSKGPGKKVKLPDVDVVVPPFQHVFEGLSSYSNYSVRIRCDNEVGSSPFSPWVGFHTPEAAPSAAPKNFTFELSEQQLTLSWAALDQEELRGRLLAYKVQWNQGGESQDPLLFKDNVARLSGAGRFFNATFQVAACTTAGCGPWSQPVLVMPVSAMQAQTQRGHLWVGLLFGLLVATMVGLLLIVLVRNRGKETQFGSAFAASGTDVPVSFTAARSFNRQFPEPPESTLDSLGINSDLKAKLQDVLISERLLTLGRMLGKGTL
ncbi:hypothetical protein cypCar_00001248 [Cyprinus carpio]|nr:hypothetical protein cypCar_00001248 [Cyprinus carpio]